ncbi:Nonribosomal peptide synthetases (NRPS) [Penicillium samsonianum]|uniref:Nonribosomal peptide synthetases (NRPS) n=1 Tax=Penicillium samsonianum TaxID=1882272 RepID=UPI0025469429|nr:Nonribosomal peptide synthetases (NRPS) [Penicillium samsonianum]KAJ6118241.1 Nonribosomal peptide synthetases (NRPS) [Penicillium samsonianum]
MLEVLSRTDLGYVWYPSLKESDTTLKLNTTWDDARLHASEVSQAMKGFLHATAWLSKPENWERPARECRFEITDVGPVKCYRR